MKNTNAVRTEIHYAQVGEYQLPLLTLPQTDDSEPLGKYGRMRLAYLKTQRPVLYHQMLLNGTLWPHLQDVQKTACEWLERTMPTLLDKHPAPGKEANLSEKSDGLQRDFENDGSTELQCMGNRQAHQRLSDGRPLLAAIQRR